MYNLYKFALILEEERNENPIYRNGKRSWDRFGDKLSIWLIGLPLELIAYYAVIKLAYAFYLVMI